MKKKQQKPDAPKRFTQSRLSSEELQAHRQSMAFCDDLIRMTQARTKLARSLSAEHQRLTSLLEISLGDLRSIMPLLLVEMKRLTEDTRQIVLKAIKIGNAETAAFGARSLATWSREYSELTDAA